MVNKIGHFLEHHMFILATSIAMVVHSTWTFGTLFAGQQPIVYPNDPSTILAYLFWVTPALLVALAIDIGQIQTSVKIANAKNFSGHQIALGVTFVMLAAAGFYLQWFHLAHHIPALEFGAGLTDEMQGSLEGLKSLAIFVIPALLPLSTILYTVSNMSEVSEPTHDEKHNPLMIEDAQIDVSFPTLPAVNSDLDDTQQAEPIRSIAADISNNANVSTVLEIEADYSDDSLTDSDQVDRHCENCHKVLPETARANQKYCSDSCRQQAYLKRQTQA